MPTRKSQYTLSLLRTHRRLTKPGGSQFIMDFNPPADVVAKISMRGTTGEVIEGLGMPVLRVTPKEQIDKSRIILHMHGGAYVSGGLLQSRAVISPICAASGTTAVTFSYRLAPENPYPAQLEDALKVYQSLLDEGFEPRNIAFVGESAGGNLALVLALYLRDHGMAMPGAISLLSPWTDLLQTGESYRTLREEDATLDADQVLRSALDFAGGSAAKLSDPMLSPIYADFHGFPPTQIQCGTKEILLSDADTLEKCMSRDDVPVQIIRWEGMCHVFQIYGFEESRLSIEAIGLFIKRHLHGMEALASPKLAADALL